MKKHIPNLLTCSNLISGCIATYYAFCGEYQVAFLLIMLGATFDFFDGFAARLLHVASPIGKELDSLADDITFGFAPAAIVLPHPDTLAPSQCHQIVGDDVGHYALPALWRVPDWFFFGFTTGKFNLTNDRLNLYRNGSGQCPLLGFAERRYESVDGEPLARFYPLGGVVASCWLLVARFPCLRSSLNRLPSDNVLRYSFILCSAILSGCNGWGLPSSSAHHYDFGNEQPHYI
ncbi:MAG: CDP-alcohol phosphatidyltransferase family protein [Prevotellamassilia sp.]